MVQLDSAARPNEKQEIDLTDMETSGGLREAMQAALAPCCSSGGIEGLEARELEKGSKQQIDKLVPSGNPQLKEGLNELASTPTGAKMVNWIASNGWRVGVPPSLSTGGTIDFDNKIVLVERDM